MPVVPLSPVRVYTFFHLSAYAYSNNLIISVSPPIKMRVTCYRILVAEYGRVHRLPFGIIHLHDGRRHIQLLSYCHREPSPTCRTAYNETRAPQTLPLIVEAAIPPTSVSDIHSHWRYKKETHPPFCRTRCHRSHAPVYHNLWHTKGKSFRHTPPASFRRVLYTPRTDSFFHLTAPASAIECFSGYPPGKYNKSVSCAMGDILFRIEERDIAHSAQHLQMFFINERERLLVTCHQDTQVARFPTADKLLIPFPRFPQRNRCLRQQQFPIHALLQ